MATPEVFISYSHEDESWKERLRSHLRVMERRGTAVFWDTSDLEPGADWATEIEKAVSQSDIAVLLISPSFLASDYVVTNELPALLKRRHKEGLAVVPVLVRPSMGRRCQKSRNCNLRTTHPSLCLRSRKWNRTRRMPPSRNK